MNIPDQFDHAAAWCGRDLAAEPEMWCREFSAAEVDELCKAATSFLATDGNIASMTRQNFPLPLLATELTALRNTLMHGRGFALWRGLPVSELSREQAATIFYGIGAHLGLARSQNAAGHLLGHVTDVGADLNQPGTRIYQTAKRQSFHTDSTDVVGLLCLQKAASGGESMLCSTLTLYNEMQRRYPALTSWLFEPVATDRRGEVPEGCQTWFEIPVLNWYEGYLSGLYQRNYINSAEQLPGAPALHPQHREALDCFDALANDPDLHLRMQLEPGDLQFVYNHHLLHDRMAFRDDAGSPRYLLRLWLSLSDDRPLPPIYAQRYGSIEIGNRGGIITEGTELKVTLLP